MRGAKFFAVPGATPEIALRAAVTKLVKEHPFYGSLVLSLPIVAAERIPSFATCGSAIYYNPVFVQDCSKSDLVFILVHELEHIVRSHAQRKGCRVRLLWNIATDYGINQDLIDYGLEPPRKLGRMIGLYDPSFRGLASEAIYPMVSGLFTKESPLWTAGHLNERQLRELDPLTGDVVPTPRSAVGEKYEPINNGPIRSFPSQRAGALVRRAALAQPDQIPRHLRERLGLRSSAGWQQLLEEYIRSRNRQGAQWSQLNRRTRHLGIKIPSGPNAGFASMALILDVSGSMSGLLAAFLEVLRDILTEIAPRQVIAMLIDSETRAVYEGDWRSVLANLSDRESVQDFGGGTDLRPAFSEIENLAWSPDVVVCLTDMKTDWPRSFRMEDRTVFVTSKARSAGPFGETVLLA